MSSKRRRAASRANGKKSKGPVTPEGKARSAANAVTRHGLSVTPERAAHAVCLTNENRAEFTLLHQGLIAEHAPATLTEDLLVHEMAVCRWRLHRAWGMESALLDNQMDHMTDDVAKSYRSTDECTRTALAFRKLSDDSPSHTVLHRYETRLSRQFDRCLKRLDALRAAREKTDLPCDPNPINEHLPNDSQLQRHQSPAPTQPARIPQQRAAVDPPPGTPEVPAVSRHAQPDDIDSQSGPAPALPRAA